MTVDWYPSVVVAIWHEDGIELEALTELNRATSDVGARFVQFLQPNWFVVVLDDSARSLRWVEEMAYKIITTKTLQHLKIGQQSGAVLMELDAHGRSTIRPTGSPMHGAMLDAQRQAGNNKRAGSHID